MAYQGSEDIRNAKKLKQIHPRIPGWLNDRLEAYMDENQTSQESVVTDALKEHLKDKPPKILI